MSENSERSAERLSNWRNSLPIIGTYLYIAGVVLVALWFFRYREGRFPWWTDIPVAIVALVFIAPGQHRLLLLGQEAARGCLFRNRWLNELVGDWLLHFPFSLATQQVRLTTTMHDQFTADPGLDAEQVIAERSGFRPFEWKRLLRLSALLKWNSLRTNLHFQQNANHPFLDPNRPPSKLALHVGTVYVLAMFSVLIYLFFQPNETILTYVPPGLWLLVMMVFLVLPAKAYHHATLPSLYSPKVMTLMRITFITLLNLALGWTSYLTERSGVLNYVALWIAPYVTVTSSLMIMRHWRQHGMDGVPKNPTAGFLGRFLLFPLGERHHVEKHVHPGRPWFRLGKGSDYVKEYSITRTKV